MPGASDTAASQLRLRIGSAASSWLLMLVATCVEVTSMIGDSPVTVTGCRFHFTFTVAPMADPVDMARLRADVPAIPEAAGRTLTLRPEGIDHYQVEAVYDALERLETWAALRGASMAAVATAWLLHRPEVTAVVVGPSRVEHLDAFAAGLHVSLTEAETAELATWFT